MPSIGRAAKLDHLLCERMSDPQKLQSAVDLIAELQPEFTAKGCIVVKPIEFCVPATKTNVRPAPPLPGVVGAALKNDYICYLMKCPAQTPPPDKLVVDQFGVRTERKYRPYKLCVPARKAPVPCGATGRRQCGGACPDPGQTCSILPTDGCGCLPQMPPPCGLDPKAGVCGGLCPDPLDRCIYTLTPPSDPTGQIVGTGGPDTGVNPCHCAHEALPCQGNPATGACGGTCPNATDVCTQPAGATCGCYPPPPTCGLDTAGQCGGTCPGGKQCTQPPGAVCGCYPPPTPCAADGNGACGGACPNAGDVCTQPAGATCGCYPHSPTCQLDAAGLCGGTCPTGFTCKQPTNGGCDCYPDATTPCDQSQPPQCGGSGCPAPALCRMNAAGACACQ